MKKIKELPESDFLKLFFACFSAFFLVAAFCMPDRADMLPGLWRIISEPCKVSTSWFYVGGFAATFLNMGLVALACTALIVITDFTANNVTTLAVILTTGFGSWGINILNMWLSIAGVFLYCIIKKDPLNKHVHGMMFSTGIAPMLTDLMVRYPHQEAIGFNVVGVCIAIAAGLLIGLALPAGLNHSPKVHKGFDLYSAALPVGMTAFFLQGVLFKSMGVDLPASPPAETLKFANPVLTNTFCIVLFGSAIIAAFAMGCTVKDYWKLLIDPALVKSFSGTYGNQVFLMNFGVFGLFILGYYNLIGGTFNGVTFGIIFCMLATCNSGSHPFNVIPIMLGYYFTSIVIGWLAPMLGGNFTGAINAQAIMVGLCYANGLSPIPDKYGYGFGILAGSMHYLLVTSVPALHGGYCLYNGGFTAALICIILMPTLERMADDKFTRRGWKNPAQE